MAERRLTAILAADVIGYLRLIEAGDVGTRRAFNVHLNELIERAMGYWPSLPAS